MEINYQIIELIAVKFSIDGLIVAPLYGRVDLVMPVSEGRGGGMKLRPTLRLELNPINNAERLQLICWCEVIYLNYTPASEAHSWLKSFIYWQKRKQNCWDLFRVVAGNQTTDPWAQRGATRRFSAGARKATDLVYFQMERGQWWR